ncbi:GIY-YIG nuclease family protein [Pseudoxanthomonas sp. PXM02]|uniref:GIY-YIG nuclease family protein n=1 Tax=Pseudoxanthomonas sp. PXM02 TaxID=2769294 RepID=UPI001786536C|nr:GIY-YIG nuclease family protein [Pseudoxanthomonas sp. PXM02]MBD9477552.1 GIY-YIG nuclease family protein [Pseudoxanthomonas sp. PXM02]
MDKQPATYMLSSQRNGTLYIGVTSDLVGRIWQHRHHAVPGFSHRYGVTQLVWYELHETMDAAITREKRLKKWERAWKIRLIEQSNPYWNDLWHDIIGQGQVTGSPPSRG